MLNELAQSWLTLQCQMIPGVSRAILMLDAVANGKVAPAASWPSSQQDTEPLVELGRLALQEKAPVIQPDNLANVGHADGPVIVACPLFQHDQLFGVVALEVEALDEQQQNTLLQLLKWGSVWLRLLLSSAGEVIGAITFERRHGPAFDDAAIDVYEAIAALIGRQSNGFAKPAPL